MDHDALWPKMHRVLPQPVVEEIKGFAFVQTLAREFGSFSFSEVVSANGVARGHEEVYWRIVRPGIQSDVGPLHADKWFHDVLGDEHGRLLPENATTVKVWIPLYAEPGRNGLIVVPDSHLRVWNYEYLESGGIKRPRLTEDQSKLGGILVNACPGTPVLFNERLLHGGALNQGASTRVSAEITLVFESAPATSH